MVIRIGVGSENHYARAFDYRAIEFSKKPFKFGNNEAGTSNPHHVKKSKELDDNNSPKNDCKNPKVIAGLVKEGRYMIPYLPDGIYADLRTALNMKFQLQSELRRIQNRIIESAVDSTYIFLNTRMYTENQIR